MTHLFINIKELVQVREASVKKVSGKEMNILPSIKNAFLIIKNGLIFDFGNMSNLKESNFDKKTDCTGKIILPTWCDSHTHIVYTGNREQEFVDRINGLSYEEIANNGGGILNSAKNLQAISEENLYDESAKRLEEVITLGTGAIEIKSGYGLTVSSELKMLRVIKKLKENYDIPIKATFLGAHAVPKDFKNNKQKYINLIIDKMLPEIAKENLADFIDIFCEVGYFSVDDTDKILHDSITELNNFITYYNEQYTIISISHNMVCKNIQYGGRKRHFRHHIVDDEGENHHSVIVNYKSCEINEKTITCKISDVKNK